MFVYMLLLRYVTLVFALFRASAGAKPLTKNGNIFFKSVAAKENPAIPAAIVEVFCPRALDIDTKAILAAEKIP